MRKNKKKKILHQTFYIKNKTNRSMLSESRSWAKNVFTLDLHCLALYRIGLCSIIVFQLIYLLPYLDDFFGEHGLAPCVMSGKYTGSWVISVYMYICERPDLCLIFYAIHLTFAVVVGLGLGGWKARIILWYMQMSFNVRISPLSNGGDILLLLLVWWMMWLPVSERYTVSKKKTRKEEEEEKEGSCSTEYSWATVGLVLQMCHIYFWNGYHKTGRSWRYPYMALHHVLSDPSVSTWIGYNFLRERITVTRVLTWVTLRAEMLFPVFAMWPFTGWNLATECGQINLFVLLRCISVFTMIGFHTGIMLTMRVGIFGQVPVCGLIAIIPHFVIERYIRRENVVLPYYTKSGSSLRKRPSLRHIGLQMTACFFVFVMISENLHGVSEITDPVVLSGSLAKMAKTLAIDQKWAMFAPEVGNEPFWHVVTGRLKDNSVVDLMKNIPYTVNDTLLVQSMFPTYHHRRYMRQLEISKKDKLETKYICMRLTKHWCHKIPDLVGVSVLKHSKKTYQNKVYSRVHCGEMLCAQNKPP